jgi:hypothetical protein
MWRRFGLQNGGVHIAGQQNQVRGDSQLSKELRDLAALDRRGSALGVLNKFFLYWLLICVDRTQKFGCKSKAMTFGWTEMFY